MSSKKSIQLVSFEALIVGVCLAILVYIVKKYITIPNITGYPMDIELFIIVGALFHILFEYSGVNLWYSLEYCKLVKM